MDDWQATYRGYTIGTGDVSLLGVDGVEGLPDVRTSDRPRPRSTGMVVGPQFAGGRTITLTVEVAGTDGEDSPLADLRAVASIDGDPEPFAWKIPGHPERQVWARSRRLDAPIDQQFSFGLATVTWQLHATDPRIYGTTLKSDSTGVGETTGGLAFPHGFPHGFGFASPGVIQVENDGSALAPWTATLTGPLSSPRISLVGGGGVLELAGFTLSAGQQLVLDSAERSVILNGSASRYGALTQREWFDLPAGSSSVQLNASSGSGTLALSWRDTWI